MYGLAIYVKEGIPFAQDLFLKHSDSLVCFQFTLLHLVSSFYSNGHGPLICADLMPFNIDEVLPTKLPPNVLIFKTTLDS